MELSLDCRDGMTVIHDRLSEAMGFPHWYGRNLDALHDCLTDICTDVQIRLLEPDLLPDLRQVLEDCAEENPHIQLFL